MKSPVRLLLLILLIIAPNSGYAEDVFCAQVMPCNSDGSVQSPFNTGPCAGYYASICKGQVVDDIGDDLSSCESEKAILQKKQADLNISLEQSQQEIESLRQELARSQRKIRRLRSLNSK